MDDAHFWRLAAKYFAGEASEEEVSMLKVWIESDPSRRDQLAQADQAWGRQKRREAAPVDVRAAWNRFERRIETGEARPTPLAGPATSDRFDRAARRGGHSARRLLLLALAGAAVLLLFAVAVLLRTKPRDEVIVTEAGERTSIELADGTRVLLNAGSRLSIQDPSSPDAREVFLEGEAFFDVDRDERRPFLVHTREGVIRVLGTAFNVDAYADEQRVSVAVTEGAVALLVERSTPAATQDTVVLRPRQIGVMAGRRLQTVYYDVDLAAQLAWREGRLVFEDAPFHEVARRLERWYGLEIDASSLDSVDRLNAVFEEQPADDVVRDIAMALELQYEQDGDRITFRQQRTPAATDPPPSTP